MANKLRDENEIRRIFETMQIETEQKRERILERTYSVKNTPVPQYSLWLSNSSDPTIADQYNHA